MTRLVKRPFIFSCSARPLGSTIHHTPPQSQHLAMVKITVQSRPSKKSTSAPKPAIMIDFPGRHSDKITVKEVKKSIQAKFPKLGLTRQRLTTTSDVVLTDDDKSIGSYGVTEDDVLQLKDLGRQISWKTVFLIEYAGPLVIHPLFFFYGRQIFGTIFSILGEQIVPYEHSAMQKTAFCLIMLHYIKRELETLFVHRFSNATMPFFNVFKNSAHYHLLSGLLLSLGLYGPWNSAYKLAGATRNSDFWLTAWSVFIMWAQASNLYTHLTLRSLRPAGTKKRSIPTGYGFDLVYSANYLFESLVWIGTTIMTGSVACGIFTAVSVGQMVIWAIKKKKNYKKEFGKECPPGRKAIFPYLI
ncbi:Steroid reductase required for elongation of the very long chain fatty acids [Phaffia rhodozyma]|uniref:Steroid reductase required for elongation of the very long chain fatty acids n=1 Tax=Phaffia rhodozyma TaxID=264483 RepID=A0A0F7SXQ9_PHARH|nr:Steroid reductase required for elongation of the very long chain fatty acids [Phaffia rhodozyma]